MDVIMKNPRRKTAGQTPAPAKTGIRYEIFFIEKTKETGLSQDSLISNQVGCPKVPRAEITQGD